MQCDVTPASSSFQVQRFVDVNFNRLETTVNLQTWVVLLDFLGLGAKVHDPAQFSTESKQRESEDSRADVAPEVRNDDDNMEVKLSIASLSLVLNKPEYELAKASVTGVSAGVTTCDGNVSVSGQLVSLSIQDSSPYGTLYRERFITSGSQALEFDIFK